MHISRVCCIVVIVLVGIIGTLADDQKPRISRDPLTHKQMKYLRRLLRLQGNRRSHGKSFVIKGDEHSSPGPELSIAADNKVIYSGGLLDMNPGEEPVHRRSARSLSLKNIPMISSKVVRKGHQEQHRESPSEQEPLTYLPIDSEPMNGEDSSRPGMAITGPMSVSETIPTNGGVTKVDINLSFGCLFFCE